MAADHDMHSRFAEDVSASLSRCLEEMDRNIDPAARPAGGKSASKSRSSISAPSADNMAEALASPINKVLGKADGLFLAGLLDGKGLDDPAARDYGERYQYIDPIGEGGQGKVLRFRDTVLDRDVAIKVVKAPYTGDRERLLENEARLGGMLEHPNILPTYDLCRDETGSPFFVMKKVEGSSFDELLKKAHAEGDIHSHRDRGEFSRRRLLNIFLQVCHAMEYAHSRGVCHLDLKPQNVKLGPFGEVYVLDWGFASRIEDNPKMVAGTPLYIAPERFRAGKPDQRCDVYSLGVMLYRILVNQLPRDVGKTSFREFRKRIQDFPVIPPRQRDPSLPRDLEAIIMKALEENPDGRYQTVRALADDLERFLDILPVSAYREGLWGRAAKFARRHRAPVLAGAVMLAALVLTAGANIHARSLAAQTEAAELQAKAAELQARLDREEADKALGKMREAEEERGLAIASQRKAEAERLAAEKRRIELTRRRAAARVPLEKGMDIMDKSKVAVAKEKDRAKKLQVVQPAVDLFTQSLAILERKGEASQDAAPAYYARARAYEEAQELSKAAADYKAAYQRDPSFIMAHYYLGLLNFEQHRNEKEAIREFAAMNEIDPGNEFSEIGQ
ncbi:MAG: protein kinase, partial [Planctomycetota bacterium]|nr:protein kinase [Planctomycetota bacterium]